MCFSMPMGILLNHSSTQSTTAVTTLRRIALVVILSKNVVQMLSLLCSIKINYSGDLTTSANVLSTSSTPVQFSDLISLSHGRFPHHFLVSHLCEPNI